VSELVHPRAAELDGMSTLDLLRVLQAEDRHAVDAVGEQLSGVAKAVAAICDGIRAGGAVHYFGAGTSGRLAELDALECGPTFGIDPRLVIAHAGGDGEAEDDGPRGTADAKSAGMTSRDVVVAVSASGTTAYVLGAADEARKAGALVVAVTCVNGSQLAREADVSIEIEVGPEVIAGSSRLKAGTAQKVVLNLISTAVFTRLGHTYRGRMVGVAAVNRKQRTRALRLVADLTGASDSDAKRALNDARWRGKVAVLMLRAGLDASEAGARLERVQGDLAAALGERALA
jgi:N-acetylmuramic acid 6-phosphate etherase